MADTENEKSTIYGYSSFGYEGNIIYVETDLRRGIPAVDIVGLADGVVSDVRNRIRSAFTKQNLPFPPERVLMSLSPADIRKDGDMLPLAMALSVLNEEHGGYGHDGEKILAVGDIDSNGNILPVRGVTAALEKAVSEGITNFVVPDINANEALLVPGAKVLSVSTLSEAHEKLFANEKFISIEDTNLKKNEPSGITFDEKLLDEASSMSLDGYYDVCRAIEIAVAGRHNILLEGAPGSGKTLLSYCLIPALTPDLTKEEANTVKRIKSIAGLLNPNDIDSRRPPFRMPYRSSSLEGMVGGGSDIRPGEITLAHNGTLFLDDASEFRFSVLQSLRVPMENKSITLSRAGRHTMYPADAQIVMANNPCPCGNYGSAGKICLCSDKSVDQYWKKIDSGVLSRIEIKQHFEKDEKDTRKITVQEMKEHVANAYKIQRENGVKNSALNGVEFAKMCKLDQKCQEFFDGIKDNYSVRDGQNMLKVALTIANMDNRREISLDDIRESAELVAPIFGKPKNFRREPAVETAAQTKKSNFTNEKTYLDSLKNCLKDALNETARPLSDIPFTRENYNKLFPYSMIDTPVEKVKLGEHQFEKLNANERQSILQAVYDTLKIPDLVINEERQSVFGDMNAAHIYAKSFVMNGKNKAVQSVVVSIENENVSISTHERDINNVVNKIKKPDQLIYVSDEIGQMIERTTGKQLVTVNPTREDVLNVPPLKTISNSYEKSTPFPPQHEEHVPASNTEPVTIDVDGTLRECKEGLAEGFRNAVRRLDKIIDTNNELCDENEKLTKENKALQNENQKLRRELGGVGFKGN
ncbi:MAG: YifB family Mg chelatase-like AAA ATPase [Treponemataceae bacterium]|nr:YifB family Mg chelatase-like AAA ATPase [Treponemataceae bacterium]